MTDYLTTRLLAQRWKVTTRTIDRWVASGSLPHPTRINGRKYWPSDIESPLKKAVPARLPWHKPKISERGTVYVVGAASHIKIGWTNNLEIRLKTMRVYAPKGLRVLARFAGWKEDERKLHQEFADYRLNGEWFRQPPNLFEVIDRYAGQGS